MDFFIKKGMLWFLMASVLGVFLPLSVILSTSPAQAQADALNEAPPSKPEETNPAIIAMVYAKLSRQTPNFEDLARKTEAYKNASAFEQPSILDNETQKLKE